MFKIGTDIVKISRIESSIKKQSFLNFVYTDNEIKYCKSSQSFAGLFDAKEALVKALECGIDKPLSNYEILHNEAGAPYFSKLKNSSVSISHDGDYAMATVIIWE